MAIYETAKDDLLQLLEDHIYEYCEFAESHEEFATEADGIISVLEYAHFLLSSRKSS
jgi:hypothetical protein